LHAVPPAPDNLSTTAVFVAGDDHVRQKVLGLYRRIALVMPQPEPQVPIRTICD